MRNLGEKQRFVFSRSLPNTCVPLIPSDVTVALAFGEPLQEALIVLVGVYILL